MTSIEFIKKQHSGLSLGFVVLTVLVILFPSIATGEHSTSLTVFSGTAPIFASVFVADAKGFFKRHGVDVRVRIFDTGATALTAFKAGRAEFLAGCDFAQTSLLQIQDVVFLSPIARDDTQTISGGPGIHRVADLKGKKVGLRLKSTAEFVLVRALKRANLGIKDVELVNLIPADAVPALVRGDIDAASWWPPFNWQAEEASGGKVKTIATGETNCLISAVRKHVETHPRETITFLRALYDATKWLNQVSLDERARVVSSYTKLDLKSTKAIMELTKFDMTETPDYRTFMKEMADFMLETGLMEKPVAWEKVLGSRYLREVDPSLVK